MEKGNDVSVMILGMATRGVVVIEEPIMEALVKLEELLLKLIVEVVLVVVVDSSVSESTVMKLLDEPVVVTMLV